ncbi:Na/H antiporter [Bisporella sp. PMI_857]|nr:Na/H antiporter [Bisporella sp. PMI_857]
MPTLAVTNFNIVCSVLGGFITLFGLVSYLFKEKFYLSEALISLLAGVTFSPHATNFVRPLEYTGSQSNLNAVTLYFSRLVLGVQLVLAGVQLPSRYLKTEWKALALLLGPIMTLMWVASSLLIWALVPNLPYVHALAIAACVTPTDPVLSNSIVKGKFADKNVPKDLQKIIIAESGANDGLGYPFLFIALYLIKYTGHDGLGQHGGAGKAMELWFGETWGYVIILSVVYGAVVGWGAKELLHWAEERKFVDRESFLVFAITLSLFIIGTCGILGSDDVLACFIAGNAFTWDDWFRLQTLDDSLQPTIDMLLNLSIFIWFGAVCPWSLFGDNEIIPVYRLIALGVLILLFRRLPVVFAFHRYIHQIEEKRQAIFVGFFGPIGVSAIFYLYVSLEFLETIKVDGIVREDAEKLREAMMIIVWFLAICSIIVHGLSVPLGKLGFFLPRTLSRAFSHNSDDEHESLPVRNFRASTISVLRERRRRNSTSGRTTPVVGQGTTSPRSATAFRGEESADIEPGTPPLVASSRTIKFPDEPLPAQLSLDQSGRRV